MSIHISKLQKYYGDAVGIESVTLDIKAGDFYGFIGPNGAGKSTTLRVLTNILFASSGKASINGLDIKKMRWHSKHRLAICLPKSNSIGILQ